MITIERKVRFRRSPRKTEAKREVATLPVGRVPRVARLMALAIRLDQLIRDGVVTDQAELARLGYVTRARLTQIMCLLQLAPDLQEYLLFSAEMRNGRDAITERQLRPIAHAMAWCMQRSLWDQLVLPLT